MSHLLLALAVGCTPPLTASDTASLSSDRSNARVDGGTVDSDPDDNGVLDAGTTAPVIDLSIKGSCSGDITATYEVCLVEKIDGSEVVSIDLNGREICGDWETHISCVDGVAIQDTPRCVGGDYCEVEIFVSTTQAHPAHGKPPGHEVAGGAACVPRLNGN